MSGVMIMGTVVERDGPEEGRSIERTYTIKWDLPSGATYQQAGVGCRQLSADEMVWRRAFPINSIVFGYFRAGTESPIVLIDREDYAVGCDEEAAAAAMGRARTTTDEEQT